MLRAMLSILVIPYLFSISFAQETFTTAVAKTISPLIDSETWFVVRLDLSEFDMAKGVELIQKIIPSQEQLTQAQEGIKAWQILFRKQGGKEIYLVYGGNDFPQTPCYLIPLADWREGKEMAQLFTLVSNEKDSHSAKIGNFLAIGSKKALEELKSRQSSPRTDLFAGFAAIEKYPAQIVLSPGPTARKIFEEIAPTLPKEFGGGSIELFTRGMKWIAVGIDAPPKMNIHAIVQANSNESASKIAGVWTKLLGFLGNEKIAENETVSKAFPKWVQKMTEVLTPKIDHDRLVVSIEGNVVFAELAKIAKEMAGNADSIRSMNNLKQLLLALHNYHDVYSHFPTDIVDKKGKPLLSWRVAILPFIEQDALYKEFKLDEPWDSDHNKKLIAKMPKTFRSPKQDAKLIDRTTYVAPLGKGLMWDDPKGVKISSVLDGTSNTITLVEADDEHSVIWSKPEDYLIDEKNPFRGLLAHYEDGFLAGFADGSVRMMPRKVKNLYYWFTRAGGEVVGEK